MEPSEFTSPLAKTADKQFTETFKKGELPEPDVRSGFGSFFSREVKAIIFAGLLLILALLWNDIFIRFFEEFTPYNTLLGEVIYVLIITIIIIGTLYYAYRNKPIKKIVL